VRRSGRRPDPEYERVSMDDDKPDRADKGEKFVPGPPKTKISLLKAMLRANVSSSDTCEMLLRGGFVRLNGLVVDDGKTRVDLLMDLISVRGKDLTYPQFDDESGGGKVGGGDGSEDDSTLTRAQKDFRKGKFAEEGQKPRDKKYSRHIDGGFYSGRRWSAGK
jgi:hypothetical protein